MNQERRALEQASRHALDYLDRLDSMPVAATAGLEELRARLSHPLKDEGLPAHEVIDALVRDTHGGHHSSAGGRFFGWVIGGTLPSALAADWLTSTWDQNAGMYAVAPAAAVVEEVAGSWLKELLGIPEHASFALATGCQMAHFTCLAAARHAVLSRRGWDVENDGLAGAPQVRILTSQEVHGTVEIAARYLGLGRRSVLPLEADLDGRLEMRSFESALQSNEGPSIVVLHAGDLNLGAFDPFEEAIELAHAAGAWVHVDGAFGLWAAASQTYRHLLTGVEKADSWATDGHKWLNVPYDCGYAFVADRAAHFGSMSHRASYLTHADDARDQIDWNPEFSRRARGFATYAAIRELGRTGLADLIDRSCKYARDLVNGIGALPGAVRLWEPQINQGLVRFPDPHPDATEADHDAWTDTIMARVLSSGEAFFTGSTWRGRRCMRVSVSGWRTTASDVERAINAVAAALTQ